MGSSQQRQGEGFAERIGRGLEAQAHDLAREWLDRVLGRLPEAPQRVFPEDTLLERVPDLVKCIGRGLASGPSPEDEEFLLRELSALARLRRSQGYEVEELLAEFEILGRIVFDRVRDEAALSDAPARAAQVADACHRLHRAMIGISRVTAEAFQAQATEDRSERAGALGAYGRAISHDLKNRINAAGLAVQMLERQPAFAGDEERRYLGFLEQALEGLRALAWDVQALTAAQGGTRAVEGRRQSLAELLEEVASAAGEIAAQAGVELRMGGPAPDVQVDASRVQLILVSLIGIAIQLADPAKSARWVELRVARDPGGKGWRIAVADNGIGIPADRAGPLLEQGYRAGGGWGPEGSGLGLGLAQRAARQLGGGLELEGQEGYGATLAFTLEDPPGGA